jgi:metal-responsive CopG/Arc/MetJ family transcriptional regulator
MVITVPKPERAEVGKWGESKKRVQIMLTPTATDKIDAVAEQMGTTRSEVLELLIRSNCLDVEILKQVEGVKMR